MKIKKILNNNAVTVIDDFGEEVIIKGKGLAFGKSNGDQLDASKIEKTFILKSKEKGNYFAKLLQEIPSDIIEKCEKIIEDTIIASNLKVNDQIYITLTDHINNLLVRSGEGLLLDSLFLYDLKRLYDEEYKIAQKVVNAISIEFGVEVPLSECDFITLHIVNAELNNELGDTYETTSIINSICDIIESDFGIILDKDTVEYTRFLIHLKVFFDRIINNTLEQKNHQSKLMDYLATVYPKQQNCLDKICQLISIKYSSPLNDEKLYLFIHLIKLTTDSE